MPLPGESPSTPGVREGREVTAVTSTSPEDPLDEPFFLSATRGGNLVKLGSYCGYQKLGGMSAPFLPNCFTESPRLEGASGDALVQPPAQAGSARDGCSEMCPVRFGVSSRMETPQLFWVTCSRV